MCKLLTPLLNIIFPLRASEKMIIDVTEEEMLKKYHKNVFQKVIYLSDYRDKTISSAILENKFHNNKKASFLLGKLLLIWIREQTGPVLFIPIPLGKKRLRERGYNQVENILRSINSEIVFADNVLKRQFETPPQTKLKRNERLKNITGAFVYQDNGLDLTKFSTIVIIDDVVTTGATLESARASLVHQLPKDTRLILLALAH
jgi:ComF family protein